MPELLLGGPPRASARSCPCRPRKLFRRLRPPLLSPRLVAFGFLLPPPCLQLRLLSSAWSFRFLLPPPCLPPPLLSLRPCAFGFRLPPPCLQPRLLSSARAFGFLLSPPSLPVSVSCLLVPPPCVCGFLPPEPCLLSSAF